MWSQVKSDFDLSNKLLDQGRALEYNLHDRVGLP